MGGATALQEETAHKPSGTSSRAKHKVPHISTTGRAILLLLCQEVLQLVPVKHLLVSTRASTSLSASDTCQLSGMFGGEGIVNRIPLQCHPNHGQWDLFPNPIMGLVSQCGGVCPNGLVVPMID
jgi:hypothetical protein